MDEKYISKLAFESIAVRVERTIKRLWITIIILILALLGTNAGWLWYESQYEYYEITQEATADGSSDINLQNISGDYYGGQSKTNDQR